MLLLQCLYQRLSHCETVSTTNTSKRAADPNMLMISRIFSFSLYVGIMTRRVLTRAKFESGKDRCRTNAYSLAVANKDQRLLLCQEAAGQDPRKDIKELTLAKLSDPTLHSIFAGPKRKWEVKLTGRFPRTVEPDVNTGPRPKSVITLLCKLCKHLYPFKHQA